MVVGQGGSAAKIAHCPEVAVLHEQKNSQDLGFVHPLDGPW